jgi:hypothetical protein
MNVNLQDYHTSVQLQYVWALPILMDWFKLWSAPHLLDFSDLLALRITYYCVYSCYPTEVAVISKFFSSSG